MQMSMYSASIPVFMRILRNLEGLLAKGAAYAEAKGIDPEALINARLYPDMFPLCRQVQVASDMVKGCAARLAGQKPPSYADNEASFSELIERVRKTIAYLQGFESDQIDGTEGKEITLHLHSGDLTLDGYAYLTGYVIPNFFFHVTTAYDILSHNGVELGKKDFLGELDSGSGFVSKYRH